MSAIFPSRTSGAGWTGSQLFTSSGNFTVPAGVTKVGVRMVGGGGSVVTGQADCGRLLTVDAIAVTPGASMAVTVGAAGSGGTPTGGMSSFAGRAAAGGSPIDVGEVLPAHGGDGMGGFGRGTRANLAVAAQSGAVEIYW